MKTLFANQTLQPNMSATGNCHPSLLHVLGTAFYDGHKGTFCVYSRHMGTFCYVDHGQLCKMDT